jgi:hypothetical protein
LHGDADVHFSAGIVRHAFCNIFRHSANNADSHCNQDAFYRQFRKRYIKPAVRIQPDNGQPADFYIYCGRPCMGVVAVLGYASDKNTRGLVAPVFKLYGAGRIFSGSFRRSSLRQGR